LSFGFESLAETKYNKINNLAEKGGNKKTKKIRLSA